MTLDLDDETKDRISRMIATSEHIQDSGMIDWRKAHEAIAEIIGPIPAPTWRMRLEWKLERIRDAWLVLIGRRDVE